MGFIMFVVMEIKKGEEGFKEGLSGLDIKSLNDMVFFISRKWMSSESRDREIHITYHEQEV